MCRTENHINNFYKKYTECKDCKRARGLERYYEKIDKVSKQQEIYYENNRNKILLRKQSNRCIQFRDIVRFYVELENRQKAMEEIFKKFDSEINQNICKRCLQQWTKKELCYKQN